MSKLGVGLLVLGWCALFAARPAAAQSVTLSQEGVSHSRGDRADLLNTQINIADCVNDDRISFSPVVTGGEGYALEAWAGQGCDVFAVRAFVSNLNCWKLDTHAVVSINPAQIVVSVRDLLYGRTKASLPNEPPRPGLPDVCTNKIEASSAQALNVYFMLVDSAEQIQGTFAIWNASYKLTRPPAPTLVSTESADTEVSLEFSEDPSDVTVNGYQLFCDASLDTGMNDAGAADAGAAPSCEAPGAFRAGGSAETVKAFACGSASRESSNGTATGLINGVSYNVAVAALDTYDNQSVLSNVECQTPQPGAASGLPLVTPDAKSKACSVAGAVGAGGSHWPALAVLALGACLSRRRRAQGRVVRAAEG